MFCLSFLVAFQKQEPEKKKKQPKEKGKVGKKEPKPEEPLDAKFIDCSQCYKYVCHIEYTLHKELLYGIDIASWGRVAKIYTNQEVICCRSFEIDDLVIVCFSVMHASRTKNLGSFDILEFFEFTVTFKFNEDKNSLLTVSKNDNPKYFYDFKEPSASINGENKIEIQFCNVYETAAGVVPDYVKAKEVTFSEMEKEAKSSREGTYLHKMSHVPSTFHKKVLVRLIQELNEKRITYFQKLAEENQDNKVTAVDEKAKKNAKEKGKAKKAVDPDQNTIKFSGDQFLLDRVFDVHEKFNLSPSLPYVAVVYTCKDILKDYMQDSLIPFSIIIKKIYNLPPSDIRFTKLFVKYTFAGVIDEPIETEMIDINNFSKIKINHSNIFLRPDINLAELVQAIQTHVFFMKIYGVCRKETNQVSKVYGQGEFDNCVGLSHTDRYNMPLISRKDKSIVNNATDKPVEGTEVRLLAYASADLSHLMNGPVWLRVYCNLTSRTLKLCAPLKELSAYKRLSPEDDSSPFNASSLQFLYLNTLNINEDKLSDIEEAYYKESELVKYGSYIKVMAKIGIELKPSVLNDCLHSLECFSRVIVVFYDQSLAASLLSNLIMINENIGGIKDAKITTITMPSLISAVNGNIIPATGGAAEDSSFVKSGSYYSGQDSLMSSSSSQQLVGFPQLFMTGFVVDCVEKTLIMVEGYTNTTFPRILTHIFRLDPTKAKVLYDSQLVFNERFYGSFLPLRKIAVITMAEPLSSILKTSEVYLEGNVPTPAWQALIKLDLLSRANTLNGVCRNNLLPTADELMSFDLEFGIPVQTFADTAQNVKHKCLYTLARKKV